MSSTASLPAAEEPYTGPETGEVLSAADLAELERLAAGHVAVTSTRSLSLPDYAGPVTGEMAVLDGLAALERIAERQAAEALTQAFPQVRTAAPGRHRRREVPALVPARGEEDADCGGLPVMTGIAVVIPARDEGSALGASLESLAGQALRPDRIVVVVNNSSDDTAAVARRFAARPGVPATDVLVMPGRNKFRKAGALNYGIRHLIGWRRHVENGQPLPGGTRYLLTMDGDTDLDPMFLERARNVMEADQRLGGVSAACLGKRTRGGTRWSRLLLLLQRIEYGRFTATRLRRDVHTMSGAGSFYRATALNELLAARRDVFEERGSNLVEDYETTLALKQAGWRVTANQHCTAYTDLMPTLAMLIAQRVRWVRGTVDEWRRYGWCRATWLSIAGMITGIAATGYAGAWVSVSVAGIAGHGLSMDPRYLLLAAFWSLYQGWSVKHMGWKVVLFEAALLPEAAFNVARTYWLLAAIVKSYLGRAPAWS